MDKLAKTFEQAVSDLKRVRKKDMVMFILRHAESLGQKQQDVYKTMGDSNIPLTPLGVRQANAAGAILARLIKQAQLSGVQLISSTGHRSTRTAFEIFRKLNQNTYVNFDPRLDKQRFGDFDGLFTAAERAEKCPEALPVFEITKTERGIFYARPPGGESIEDVQNRMKPFFFEHNDAGNATIVVTHGTNALCLEDIALKRGVDWITDRLDTRPNCAIRMITGNELDGFQAKTICTDPIRMLEDMRRSTDTGLSLRAGA